MTDSIVQIMILLGPVIVAIGVFVYLYTHREQWRQETEELIKPKGDSFSISYVHDDTTPARIKARANELGITPEELIKRLVAECLRNAS